jgi:hypothetical protein
MTNNRQARVGRPRSEARAALAAAAAWWGALRRDEPLQGLDGQPLIGATWPELRQKACLARGHGAQVLKNMVHAGELRRIGRTLPAGADRAIGVFALAKPIEPHSAAFAPVAEAVEAMARTPA